MRRLVGSLLIIGSLAGLGHDAMAAQAGRLRYLAAVYLDDQGHGMRQPEAVACNDRSALVVADTGGGRLLRYTVGDWDAKPAGEIRAPELSLPVRVQMNSKDEVFALDGARRRVVRFNANGTFKGYLAPEGIPAPASVVPRSLAIDRNDTIYLLDIFSARVLVLDPNGRYVRAVPFPKDHGFFSDVAVDSRGTIYLVDSITTTVYATRKSPGEFAPLAKSLRAHVTFPTSIVVDGRGIIYVVDQAGGGIVLLDRDGTVLGRQLAMGWNEGLVRSPSQLCINDKGQVFVADRGNSRVQIFSIAR